MALHIKVRRTRPRVFLSEYNLEEIRRRIETTHVEEWSQLVVWSRGIAKTPRGYRLRSERLGERARRLAFMYAVRPEERLVEMALEIAPVLAGLPPSPPLSAPRVEALAQLFDSFRSQLRGDLAREMAQALARAAQDLFRERVEGRPVLSEARSQAVAPLLAAGFSIYLDHPTAQEIIGGAVHASRDLVGTLQYYLERDGGFPLGWAEGLTHLGQVPKLALLAESGLDQAWPRDVPWLVRYTEFLEEGMWDEAAPVPGEKEAGPYWPGGVSTGHRRAELWRILAMVASESGAPSALRLLRRVRLPGHQDERILYEKRPPPSLPEGGGVPAGAVGSTTLSARPGAVGSTTLSARPGADRTRLYWRAGVALFRGSEDAHAHTSSAPSPLEAVVRCPGALVAGGERLQVGSFSVSCGGALLSGVGRAPNGLSIDTDAAENAGGASSSASFPRTRHEIGESEFHTSTIIAFESDVGAILEGGRGALDWLRVDMTPAHRGEAASAVRTFVMLRGLPGGRASAFVVADDVRLARDDAEAACVVSFTARPEIDANVVTVERHGVRLRDFVLEPAPVRMSLSCMGEELSAPPEGSTAGAAGETTGDSTWRLLVKPDDTSPNDAARAVAIAALARRRPDGAASLGGAASGRADLHRRFCQVFVADSLDPPSRAIAASSGDGPESASQKGDHPGPLCARLSSEGALVIAVRCPRNDAAGRVLVIGGGDAPHVEGVTVGEVEGVAAVGLRASARARLEVAGEEPVESETSAAGAVFFDVGIPAGTGFVLTAADRGDTARIAT